MTLEDLANRCKGEVYLTINGERSNYEPRRDYLNREREELSEAEVERLCAAPNLYELQFYPETPIGFYLIYGVSLEEVLCRAEQVMESRGGDDATA